MQTEIDNNLTLIELVLFGANLAITPSDLDYFSSKFRSPKKHYISENFFDKKYPMK